MIYEQEIINWIATRSKSSPYIKIGIGDDSALLKLKSNLMLVTTDSIVENVHFKHDLSPFYIGAKAIKRGLSDIAAMAGCPNFVTVNLTTPQKTSFSFIKSLYSGIFKTLKRFQVNLIGGDFTIIKNGPISISVTVLGSKYNNIPTLTRNGAKPGNLIAVTGTLGGSILGKHYIFKPRIAEAKVVANKLKPTSMIDISDGLAVDLDRINRASNTGAILYEKQIPVSAAAKKLSKLKKEHINRALNDGEDYELLFTFPPSNLINKKIKNNTIQLKIGNKIVKIYIIGHVTNQKYNLILIDKKNNENRVFPKGFLHNLKNE